MSITMLQIFIELFNKSDLSLQSLKKNFRDSSKHFNLKI